MKIAVINEVSASIRNEDIVNALHKTTNAEVLNVGMKNPEHFVILTTQANASMAPVHSRMPLVLEREQVREWILDSAKTKELLGQEPPQLERDCEYEQQTLF